MLKLPRYPIASIAILAGGLAIACSETPTTVPTGSPLSGLTSTGRNDSSGSTNPVITGSVYFRGTVMAPSAPGAGNDSLVTAPRIPDVRVTIYPRVPTTDGSIEMGPAAGSVLTSSTGQFQLPTLPAGEYVVTFVPPENSIYRGSYAFGPLRSNSSDFPWWVVLTRK